MVMIGQLAERTGVAASKIRYYEKKGVLPEPERAPNGYRDYGPEAVARVEFLQRGKLLGLTLHELATVLRASEQGCCDQADPLLRQLLVDKVAQIDHRIDELRAMRSLLGRALDRLNPGTRPEVAQADGGCISDACTTPVAAPTEVTAMTDTNAKLTDRVAAEECCEPDRGPGTCAPTVVAFEHQQETETSSATGECCEPDCGPGICN